MSNYRYTNADLRGYGELFGLSISDLTTQQLEKIESNKLIEFVAADPRVEVVLGDRILAGTIEELACLHNVASKEMDNAPYLKEKYNETVRLRTKELLDKTDRDRYFNRSNFIFWTHLDHINRKTECERFIKQQSSVFLPGSANHKQLYQNYPDIYDNLVLVILDFGGTSACKSTVIEMPAEVYLRHIDKIFTKSSFICACTLSNPATPKSYIVKALREIAGKKTHLPVINVELSKEVLVALPTMMRIGVLETLLYHNHSGKIKFSDISTAEDLYNLVFGATLKYHERIQRLLNQFRYRFEKRKDND